MAVMPMPKQAWTDERLDDLNKKVDEGFKDMRAEFRAIRGEMQGSRGEIQSVRDEVAAMNRNLIQLTWGLIGTMLVGFLGTTAAIATQL
jgi:hypothetical protein